MIRMVTPEPPNETEKEGGAPCTGGKMAIRRSAVHKLHILNLLKAHKALQPVGPLSLELLVARGRGGPT